MIAEIDDQKQSIAALCRKHKVRRLEVFGSAADGTFDPDHSDLDFLVEFDELKSAGRADAYFGLWEDLGKLFGRKVDLVEPGAMRNPYFIRRVNETRTVLYDARS